MQKPKFTLPQLYERLDDKGVTFKYHNEKEAIEIMENRNYYYRLTSYRKNYEKLNEKYVNLDFKALVDIASVDSYLREYLLSLCLDVEHASKTKIMKLITKNPNEDGYSIIEELNNSSSAIYRKAYDNVAMTLETTKYKKDLKEKRVEDISTWVFLEFASLTDTQCLLELYSSKYRNKKLREVVENLKYVKNIRNSCAHNNTYLVNIFDDSLKIDYPPQQSKKIAKELKIEEFCLEYQKTHDLIMLFNLHIKMNSKELRQRRKIQGKELLDRAERNSELHSIIIKAYFKILSKLVDKL